MPRYSISITKSLQYKGKTEEFSNVYTYNVATQPGDADLELALDALVAIEKALFSNLVTFVKGRVWGPLGDPLTSIIRVEKVLTGNGTSLAATHLMREQAVMVADELPRKPTTQKRRWLRKYYHLGALASGASDIAYGITPIPTAEVTRIKDAFNDAKNLVAGTHSFDLCAGDGQQPLNKTYVKNYPLIRQFRKGTKERP